MTISPLNEHVRDGLVAGMKQSIVDNFRRSFKNPENSHFDYLWRITDSWNNDKGDYYFVLHHEVDHRYPAIRFKMNLAIDDTYLIDKRFRQQINKIGIEEIRADEFKTIEMHCLYCGSVYRVPGEHASKPGRGNCLYCGAPNY